MAKPKFITFVAPLSGKFSVRPSAILGVVPRPYNDSGPEVDILLCTGSLPAKGKLEDILALIERMED